MQLSPPYTHNHGISLPRKAAPVEFLHLLQSAGTKVRPQLWEEATISHKYSSPPPPIHIIHTLPPSPLRSLPAPPPTTDFAPEPCASALPLPACPPPHSGGASRAVSADAAAALPASSLLLPLRLWATRTSAAGRKPSQPQSRLHSHPRPGMKAAQHRPAWFFPSLPPSPARLFLIKWFLPEVKGAFRENCEGQGLVATVLRGRPLLQGRGPDCSPRSSAGEGVGCQCDACFFFMGLCSVVLGSYWSPCRILLTRETDCSFCYSCCKFFPLWCVGQQHLPPL